MTVAYAEQPVNQPVRLHFGRPRAIAIGPTHVVLDGLAKALLRHTDFQRTEAVLLAVLRAST